MPEIDKPFVPENLENGKRTLRIFDGFGEDSKDSLSYFLSGGETESQKKIVKLFKLYGFEITTGEFNENNPLEIGISSDMGINRRERDFTIAQEMGIDIPRTFSPSEILKNPMPVVVKIPEADRGEFKYLLETIDQKIKFISWALLYQNIGDLSNNEKDRNIILNEIFGKVSKGIFKDKYIKKTGQLDYWVFEEFIETPGDFNSSLRVVVDAFGNFNYAQVTRSQHIKNSENLSIPKNKDFTEEELAPLGFRLTKLLTHPDSPFYLRPKNFMSNIAQGGKRILLDGNYVKNTEDRELLIQLGFDPDKPLLSADLLEKSKEIGKLYRKHYPHIGIDYLIQKGSKKPFLLEINKGPHLSPQALGLPEETSPEDCELELIKRTITTIK